MYTGETGPQYGGREVLAVPELSDFRINGVFFNLREGI
jgi:hypothetical protein